MERKEVRGKYKKKVYEKLRESRVSVREGTSVNDLCNVIKNVVMSVVAILVGYKVFVGRRWGSAW